MVRSLYFYSFSVPWLSRRPAWRLPGTQTPGPQVKILCMGFLKPVPFSEVKFGRESYSNKGLGPSLVRPTLTRDDALRR